MNGLNVAQWETLKEKFAEIVMDGMDYKTMEQFVMEQLIDYYGGLSYHELREEVNNHNEELFDVLVDSVKYSQNPTFHMDQAFDKAHKEI